MTLLDTRPALAPALLDAPDVTSVRRHRPVREHRWASWLPLTLALALIAVVHGANIAGWPAFTNDDEGTYYAQAWAVLHEGALGHYTYWYDHPPLGWIQLAAFIEPLHWLLGDRPAVIGARVVMVGYTVASAGLLYKLARNLHIRPGLAVLGTLLWGLSPLTVFEGRQVFLDNIALPWLIGALVLATDPRRRLTAHLGSAVCFSVAVLSKETALLAGPAVLLALWLWSYRETRAFSVVGWLTAAALTVFTYPLYAILKSELVQGPGHVSIEDALDFQLFSRVGTGFLLDPAAPANETLQSWLDLDAVLLLGGAVAAVVCLAIRRFRPVAVLILVVGASMLRPTGYLPQMIVVVLLPFAALLLVGLVDVVLAQAGRMPRWAARTGQSAVAAGLAVAVVALSLTWWPTLSTAITRDDNGAYRQALSYVEREIPRDTVVVADDIAWNDLVDAGWASDGFTGAVWYFKLDRDDAAEAAGLTSWQDLDYLLVTRSMQSLLDQADLADTDPTLAEAYTNSQPVKMFGNGQQRVELRRVQEPIGPGL